MNDAMNTTELARKARNPRSRSVIEDAARECAENPRLNRDGSFDDVQDRTYLADCLERPVGACDWEYFTRRRAAHAKRVEAERVDLEHEWAL